MAHRATLLMLLWLVSSCSFTQNSDPITAKIITDDVPRFWQAFDEAAPSFAAEPFQRYLDHGTRGLDGFIEDRIRSADYLAQEVRARAGYYRSIRQETLRISTLEPVIRRAFVKLKELYPKAHFPNTYFVIGAMNSGGTANKDGLMIGTEMFGRTASTPLGELDAWSRTVVRPLDQLPYIVAHELIHFQQTSRVHEADLLSQAIYEGSADFIAQLIAGKNPDQHIFPYANHREKALWQEFETVMYGQDFSNWLYNGSESVERPADLGYWMGYKIVKAYYDRSADKQQAIAEILEVSDTKAFLQASGYAQKFK